MGSPVSPVISNIFMEAFVEEAIESSLNYTTNTFMTFNAIGEKLHCTNRKKHPEQNQRASSRYPERIHYTNQAPTSRWRSPH